MAITKKASSARKIRSKALNAASRSKPSITSLNTAAGSRQSKLEKKLAKSLQFSSKIQATVAHSQSQQEQREQQSHLNPNDPAYKNFNDISKSAVRRRKRKLKDALKPKLDDLRDTLDDISVIGNQVNESITNQGQAHGQTNANGYIGPKRQNVPNPHKSLKGQKKVEVLERQRFQGILSNSQYRSSPFAALKSQIQSNLDSIGN